MEYKSPYKNINHRKYNKWCKYLKRIDTYGNGCEHECKYCYAKALLNFRGHWNNHPSPSNLNEIHYSIKKLQPHDIIRLGSMTDCFQPMESEYMITYNTILLLNHYKIHYLIVTKSELVASDKYLSIYDRTLAHFQISISSTSDEYSLNYEKASKVSDRIKAIEKLYSYGFDVSVRLSPFINVDFNILNSINCSKILIEFLKVNHWVKKSFDIDYSEYTYRFGGHYNLQLDKKIELVNQVTGFEQKSVGEYVKEHHIYFNNEVNHNKDDCCNLTYQYPKRIIYYQQTLF